MKEQPNILTAEEVRKKIKESCSCVNKICDISIDEIIKISLASHSKEVDEATFNAYENGKLSKRGEISKLKAENEQLKISKYGERDKEIFNIMKEQISKLKADLKEAKWGRIDELELLKKQLKSSQEKIDWLEEQCFYLNQGLDEDSSSKSGSVSAGTSESISLKESVSPDTLSSKGCEKELCRFPDSLFCGDLDLQDKPMLCPECQRKQNVSK